MKEILWLDEELSKTRLLGLEYIGTYIGPDYTVLEITDERYEYLASLGRSNPLYILDNNETVIGPKCDVHIGKAVIQGWDFTIADDITPETLVMSPFDDREYYDAIYYDSLKEYLEENLGCEPEDNDDKAQMLFALAKRNNITLSDLLWHIERSNYELLVENKNYYR